MNTCSDNTSKAVLIKSISTILTEIIKDNKDKNIVNSSSPFYTSKIPKVSLTSYLERIVKYTNLESSTMIISLHYIDMYCRKANDSLCINNIHK